MLTSCIAPGKKGSDVSRVLEKQLARVNLTAYDVVGATGIDIYIYIYIYIYTYIGIGICILHKYVCMGFRPRNTSGYLGLRILGLAIPVGISA